MTLQVYVDYLSQPSRAVLIVLKMLQVPFEIKEIRIQKGENRSPEFQQISLTKRVPALKDDDFILQESHAIMKYVIRSRNISTSLYPLDDVKQCAKIDQYLDFHHTSTRKCSVWLFNKIFAQKLGVPVLIDINLSEKETLIALKFIDQKYLQNKTYLCGETITLADISAYCEIVQVLLGGMDLSPFKNITRWMDSLKDIPEFKQYHQAFNKILTVVQAKPKL